jgi:hypothetical protein
MVNRIHPPGTVNGRGATDRLVFMTGATRPAHNPHQGVQDVLPNPGRPGLVDAAANANRAASGHGNRKADQLLLALGKQPGLVGLPQERGHRAFLGCHGLVSQGFRETIGAFLRSGGPVYLPKPEKIAKRAKKRALFRNRRKS